MQKTSAAELALYFEAMSNKLPNAKICMKQLDTGTRDNLHIFSMSNDCAVGFVLNKLLADLCPDLDLSAPSNDLFVNCSIRVENVKPTSRELQSGCSTRVERTGQSIAKYSNMVLCHGASFDLIVTWTFKTPTKTLTTRKFSETIDLEPTLSQRAPLVLTPPPDQVFYVGDALALCSTGKLDQVTLGVHNEVHEVDDAMQKNENMFPRHNPRTLGIEQALEAMSKLVDHHTQWLSRYTPAASQATSVVKVPWCPHRMSVDAVEDVRVKVEQMDTDDQMAAKVAAAEGEDSTVLLSKDATKMLATFHDERIAAMLSLGDVSMLVQKLHLLKLYSSLFKNCYESIDSVMLRALYASVGPQQAEKFETRKSLDELIGKVGDYKADKAGIALPQCRHDFDGQGYGTQIRVKYPDQTYFMPLKAIRNTDESYNGTIAFGDGKKVDVQGVHHRDVAVIATDEDGVHLPSIRFDAESDFKNIPVAVVIGTPDGNLTNCDTVFMLSNGVYARMGIDVAIIPSNKKHADSMALLPTELAAFATALRKCALGTSGFVVEIVPLRPLLAQAIGVEEGDLAGDHRFEEKLINCIKAGCCLKCVHPRAGGNPAGFTLVDSPTAATNLEKIKQRVDELQEDVLRQGAVDEPEPAQTSGSRGGGGGGGGGGGLCFRSLGANADCGGYEEDTPPPATEPTNAPDAPNAPDASDAPAKSSNESHNGNFMAALMDGLHKDPDVDSGAFSGATLSQPNVTGELKFGHSTHRRQWGNTVIRPQDGKFQSDPGITSNARNLASLFRSYKGSDPIKTTRVSLYVVFTHVKADLLTGLMAGARDPTEVHLEVMKGVDKIQARSSA